MLHKVALFAIIFASLAPSISHALATQQGNISFSPLICTSSGQTITIDVVTTKGQQLATVVELNKETPVPVSLDHHLNHCPFCANPSVDHAIAAPHMPVIAQLEKQAQQLALSTSVVPPHFSVLPPPAQAPPSI